MTITEAMDHFTVPKALSEEDKMLKRKNALALLNANVLILEEVVNHQGVTGMVESIISKLETSRDQTQTPEEFMEESLFVFAAFFAQGILIGQMADNVAQPAAPFPDPSTAEFTITAELTEGI